MGSVKAILFDKDGTLSNSENQLIHLAYLRIKEAENIYKRNTTKEVNIKKLNKLLSQIYGLEASGLNPSGGLAVASRQKNLISTATIFSLLGEPWPLSENLANKIFKSVDKIIQSNPQQKIKKGLLPGASKLLASLKESGIICSLISNDSSLGIKEFIDGNNLNQEIQSFWSAENIPAKPDPLAILQLCKSLNIKPGECALIGDADSDLQMGKEAGIQIVLGYTGGWRQKPELSKHVDLINHWDELKVEQNTKVPTNIQFK